jgi:NADP-reducing hydrogenase subunit HndD
MGQSNQTLLLDGREVAFEPGQTLLEAAAAAGVNIPTLCWLKGATPTGACRVCLVEVEGARSLVAACAMPAGAGMKVHTNSERVIAARKLNIELLLASGEHNCYTCESGGDCRLQDLAYQYQVENVRFEGATQTYDIEDVNPLIIRDFKKCVMCGRCVQACNEIQVNLAISYGYRGAAAKIVTQGDRPLVDSDCVFCGECVQACPVGALTEKKARYQGRPWEMTKVRTTCPYCGVGCQQELHVKDGRIVKVKGVEDGAPNYGRLCVKGRFGYDFIHADDRLTDPLIKKDGSFKKVSWDEALDYTADRLKAIIKEHGPDAVAGVSCARSINEDSYQMQKLFRAVIGTNNIDHCART